MKPLPLSQGQTDIVLKTPAVRGFRARSHWESDQTSSTRLKPWRCQGTGHQVEGSFHPPTLPQPRSLSAQPSVHTKTAGVRCQVSESKHRPLSSGVWAEREPRGQGNNIYTVSKDRCRHVHEDGTELRRPLYPGQSKGKPRKTFLGREQKLVRADIKWRSYYNVKYCVCALTSFSPQHLHVDPGTPDTVQTVQPSRPPSLPRPLPVPTWRQHSLDVSPFFPKGSTSSLSSYLPTLSPDSPFLCMAWR